MQFDMNLLKVLYVLLQTGSTGQTAQKLSITPSAVSHSLSRLREALNDPLFHREGNRQIPTPYASELKYKLTPLFVSLNEELFGEEAHEPRTFRVVMPPALNVLLTPVLAVKGELYNAQIQCMPFERRAWRDELLDGRVDLVVAVGDHQKQTSVLSYERVDYTHLVVLYGPRLKGRLKAKTSIKFSELSEYQHFYCHPWHREFNEIDRQMARHGSQRSLAFVCQDYSQLAPALRSAPIIAVAPRPWFDTLADKQNIHMLPLDGEQAIGGLFMQYRSSAPEWKKSIISALRHVLQNYYELKPA